MKYKVVIPSNYINILNHLTTKKITNKDGYLSFYTNTKGYNILINNENSSEFLIDNISKNKFKRLIDKYLITLIGALIMMVFLINQSFTITNIVFTNHNTYDEEINDYVVNYFTKVGPFNYLNATLNDINFDLKSKFYEYEWIGVRKKGTVLYLDIKKINDYIEPDTNKTPGSIYANSDGIVKLYHLENGIVKIQEEQFVSKGDLLISGDIVHYGDVIEKTRAKGFVIAEVLEYQEFEIPKVETKTIRTGRLEIIKSFGLFKGQGKNKSEYEKYETEIETIFEVKSFIKLNKYYNYELKTVETHYTESDAIRYGLSKIYNNFKLNKINDYEKIIYCNNISVTDNGNSYMVKYIVKTYKNIGQFLPNV